MEEGSVTSQFVYQSLGQKENILAMLNAIFTEC